MQNRTKQIKQIKFPTPKLKSSSVLTTWTKQHKTEQKQQGTTKQNKTL